MLFDTLGVVLAAYTAYAAWQGEHNPRRRRGSLDHAFQVMAQILAISEAGQALAAGRRAFAL